MNATDKNKHKNKDYSAINWAMECCVPKFVAGYDGAGNYQCPLCLKGKDKFSVYMHEVTGKLIMRCHVTSCCFNLKTPQERVTMDGVSAWRIAEKMKEGDVFSRSLVDSVRTMKNKENNATLKRINTAFKREPRPITKIKRSGGDVQYTQTTEPISDAKYKKWRQDNLVDFSDGAGRDVVINFLIEKQFDKKTAEIIRRRYRLQAIRYYGKINKERGQVAIPVSDVNGSVVSHRQTFIDGGRHKVISLRGQRKRPYNIERIKESDTILHYVEGETDLYSLDVLNEPEFKEKLDQVVPSEYRNKSDGRVAVITDTGGAGSIATMQRNRTIPDWFFKGKTVILYPDVDKNDAGIDGAEKNAQTLYELGAKKVRMVILKDKNQVDGESYDLKDFILSGQSLAEPLKQAKEIQKSHNTQPLVPLAQPDEPLSGKGKKSNTDTNVTMFMRFMEEYVPYFVFADGIHASGAKPEISVGVDVSVLRECVSGTYGGGWEKDTAERFDVIYKSRCFRKIFSWIGVFDTKTEEIVGEGMMWLDDDHLTNDIQKEIVETVMFVGRGHRLKERYDDTFQTAWRLKLNKINRFVTVEKILKSRLFVPKTQAPLRDADGQRIKNKDGTLKESAPSTKKNALQFAEEMEIDVITEGEVDVGKVNKQIELIVADLNTSAEIQNKHIPISPESPYRYFDDPNHYGEMRHKKFIFSCASKMYTYKTGNTRQDVFMDIAGSTRGKSTTYRLHAGGTPTWDYLNGEDIVTVGHSEFYDLIGAEDVVNTKEFAEKSRGKLIIELSDVTFNKNVLNNVFGTNVLNPRRVHANKVSRVPINCVPIITYNYQNVNSAVSVSNNEAMRGRLIGFSWDGQVRIRELGEEINDSIQRMHGRIYKVYTALPTAEARQDFIDKLVVRAEPEGIFDGERHNQVISTEDCREWVRFLNQNPEMQRVLINAVYAVYEVEIVKAEYLADYVVLGTYHRGLRAIFKWLDGVYPDVLDRERLSGYPKEVEQRQRENGVVGYLNNKTLQLIDEALKAEGKSEDRKNIIIAKGDTQGQIYKGKPLKISEPYTVTEEKWRRFCNEMRPKIKRQVLVDLIVRESSKGNIKTKKDVSVEVLKDGTKKYHMRSPDGTVHDITEDEAVTRMENHMLDEANENRESDKVDWLTDAQKTAEGV